MSADAQLVASDRDDEPDVERCRAPNCWRDGSTVRVGDREAVLCETHRKALLGVSS